jgi:acyl transferase domain-containing protein
VQRAQLPVSSTSGNVSSFGYGGTIAHALVRRQAPDASLELSSRTELRTDYVLKRRHYEWRPHIHPFVQLQMPAANGRKFFCSPAFGALLATVKDHVVQGRVVFPGTGYLELTRAACSAALAIASAGLRAVFVVQPLLLQVDELWVQCVVGDNEFEVTSGPLEAVVVQERVVHCKGEHIVAAAHSSKPLDLGERRSSKAHCAETRSMYFTFDAVGLQYGPEFRRLTQVWLPTTCEDVSATLLPRSASQSANVHPADLDCTQHLELLMTPSQTAGGGGPRLPFAYDEVALGCARREMHSVRVRG